MIRTLVPSLLVPCLVWAQEPLSGLDANDPTAMDDLGEVEEITQPDAAQAEGALLRGLDRVSGTLTDLEIFSGGTVRLGPLEVALAECRYPVENPSGDAYAHLTILSGDDTLFEGWMIASSPALSALDHRRYDVWVLRCMTS